MQAIESVNTIVNTDGHLTAYNTDYIAVERLIAQHKVDPGLSFALRGSGGMAKAVAGALHHAGFRDGVIVVRNEHAGRHLASFTAIAGNRMNKAYRRACWSM